MVISSPQSWAPAISLGLSLESQSTRSWSWEVISVTVVGYRPTVYCPCSSDSERGLRLQPRSKLNDNDRIWCVSSVRKAYPFDTGALEVSLNDINHFISTYLHTYRRTRVSANNRNIPASLANVLTHSRWRHCRAHTSFPVLQSLSSYPCCLFLLTILMKFSLLDFTQNE